MPCYAVPPAYYEQYVSSYRDEYQIIVQKDLDGGDSAHRIGTYYFGLYLIYKDNLVILQELKNKFRQELNKIKVGPGQFVRHPDKSKWYSNPRNFSRDQTTPLVMAMGVYGETEDLTNNLVNLVKNKGFYPNDLKNWDNGEKSFPEDYNDVASVGDYGTYIRALNIKILYPALLFSDITLFGSSLIRVYFSYYDPTDTSDDLNFTLAVLQSDNTMPTPLSKVSKWIYSYFKKPNTRPLIGDSTDYSIQSAWDFYFRNEANGPPLNEVYRCLIEKSFYK